MKKLKANVPYAQTLGRLLLTTHYHQTEKDDVVVTFTHAWVFVGRPFVVPLRVCPSRGSLSTDGRMLEMMSSFISTYDPYYVHHAYDSLQRLRGIFSGVHSFLKTLNVRSQTFRAYIHMCRVASRRVWFGYFVGCHHKKSTYVRWAPQWMILAQGL